jgi:outer membrane protein OmpA-like peptidoglycan-associated protein
MGIGYIARSRPIQWELGYSFTLGPTFQIYYEIPLVKKDRNGDGIYNNVDRSRPCVLEWQRRDSTVEFIVDTIYIDPKPSQPICVNPLPIDSFNNERATNTTFYLPVAYDKDQVTLNTDIKEKLKFYLVGILKERTDLLVEIGSHTECDGRSLFNLQLTQRRADSIARYMQLEYGLDTSRMITRGYGEMTLINHCNCEGRDVVGYTPYYPNQTLKKTPNFNFIIPPA